ncbi:MAG: EamA family transporter, partial [Nitrospirota bacterium]
NLTQGLSLRSPLAVARIKGLSAGGFSLGLSWLMGFEFPDMTAIGMIMVVGFMGYGVSVVLDIYALRLLGAAREAAFFATAPFIGALAAVPILGEHWRGAEYLAGAAMAVGVGVLLREHHNHLHVHTGMEHDHAHNHIDPHHQHQHEEEVVGSHAHWHRHLPLQHDHGHVSDLHHRHEH